MGWSAVFEGDFLGPSVAVVVELGLLFCPLSLLLSPISFVGATASDAGLAFADETFASPAGGDVVF